MPSDNDKILEALAQNKKTSTDNQNITEKYIQSQEVIEERAPGSPQNNRAALSMQKFLTGRGGGVSQLVGNVLGTIGGDHFEQLKADHASKDTANYLRTKLTPLLQRNNNTLTVKQLKDTLQGISLTEGGDTIDIDQVTVLKGYKDKNQLFDLNTEEGEESFRILLDQIASQLQEIAITGSEARMNYEEYFKHISTHFTPADVAAMMTSYTLSTTTTNAEGKTINIDPIFPPTI